MTTRKHRPLPDDETTAVIPVQTLDELAAEWRAKLAAETDNSNQEPRS